MKYQSEIIHEIVEKRGHEVPNLHYQSECIEAWIEEYKGSYPKLCDYEGEWLNYIAENPIGKFPYETITDVTEATINNVVPFAFKSAILKGCTGYRDIDTGEILETFEEGRNLELVSVKMPVLTTSNEDGTKTNILTVNEEVELHGIGNVRDTLDCLTGEVVERIGEITFNGSERWSLGTKEANNTIRFKLVFSADIPDVNEMIPTITSNFPSLKNGDIDIESIQLWGSSKEINVRILKTKASTINGFKNYLSQNPLTIKYELATESVKTVDLTITNQDGQTVSKLKPIEGTMHMETNGQPLKPLLSAEVPVEAITQNLMSFINPEE